MTRRRWQQKRREPMIALINVIFLILIFFVISGTLAPPLSHDLRLPKTTELEHMRPPSDVLIIDADGEMIFRGNLLTDITIYLETFSENSPRKARIVPDRDLAALRLIEIGHSLRAAGADQVIVLTETGLQQ